MSIRKNVLPNWYSSMKKKIPMIFDIQRKLTLKVKVWHILTPPHCTNSQNSIISSRCVDSLSKIFLILYPVFENSTTRSTIAYITAFFIVTKDLHLTLVIQSSNPTLWLVNIKFGPVWRTITKGRYDVNSAALYIT